MDEQPFFVSLMSSFWLFQNTVTMIPAHDSPLAALTFNASATKLASASERVRNTFEVSDTQNRTCYAISLCFLFILTIVVSDLCKHYVGMFPVSFLHFQQSMSPLFPFNTIPSLNQVHELFVLILPVYHSGVFFISRVLFICRLVYTISPFLTLIRRRSASS